MNDVNAMDFIPYEKDSYYVFDRAYNDFRHLSNIDKARCFFVVNAYEKNLRLVEFYDSANERIFTYLTNSNKISALRVAELYKNR